MDIRNARPLRRHSIDAPPPPAPQNECGPELFLGVLITVVILLWCFASVQLQALASASFPEPSDAMFQKTDDYNQSFSTEKYGIYIWVKPGHEIFSLPPNSTKIQTLIRRIEFIYSWKVDVLCYIEEHHHKVSMFHLNTVDFLEYSNHNHMTAYMDQMYFLNVHGHYYCRSRNRYRTSSWHTYWHMNFIVFMRGMHKGKFAHYVYGVFHHLLAMFGFPTL